MGRSPRLDRGPEDVRREQTEPKVKVHLVVSASGMVIVELPRSVADRVLDEDDPVTDAEEILDYPGVSDAIMNGLDFEIDEAMGLGLPTPAGGGEDDDEDEGEGEGEGVADDDDDDDQSDPI